MRRFRPLARLTVRLAPLAALTFASVFAGRASADVKLPAIISDNMCLQARQKAPIWGWASPGEEVTVTFAEKTAETKAGPDGKWMVTIGALALSDTPAELTVKGKNSITVKNVVVGEVWACSGQSNMSFNMGGAHNAVTEIPKAKYPKIRLFTVPDKIAFEPQDDCKGHWVECTPETVKGFTAVGYFFGRDLHEALNQPVGLIHTSWGGTPAQSWTRIEVMADNPALKFYADAFHKIADHLDAEKDKYKTEALPRWEADHKKWEDAYGQAYQEKMKAWNAEVKSAQARHQPVPPRPQPEKPEPRRPNPPDQNPGTPSVLYNGMIAPIIPYAMRGVIWYQGESNAGQPDNYAVLFPAMIENWRHDWNEKVAKASQDQDTKPGDFAFLFVQLANFMERHPQPADTNWARLREAQTKTLSLPKTGMAVIIDVGQGNDIHPRDKMDVGHRLFVSAMNVAYGSQQNVAGGPLYDGKLEVRDGKVRIRFKNVGHGLTIAAAPSTQPSVLREQPLGEIKGFAIAGEDQQFVWAQAKIDGNSVLVWSDEVKNPVAVRYGWDDNPLCNLYNRNGLPASPFRTDDWPMKAPGTGGKK